MSGFDFFGLPATPLPMDWLSELVYVRSLLWYEGELIAHMRHQTRDYLLVWVDVNEHCHRWALLQVTPEDVAQVSAEIHAEVPSRKTLSRLRHAQPRGECLFVDTTGPNAYRALVAIDNTAIPDSVF